MTGHRHLEPSSATPSQAARCRNRQVYLNDPLSLCGTEHNAFRHHAIADEVPERDEEFARKGDDHLLARATGVLGTRSKPLGQGAIFLELEKAPRQLDHSPPHSSVA